MGSASDYTEAKILELLVGSTGNGVTSTAWKGQSFTPASDLLVM